MKSTVFDVFMTGGTEKGYFACRGGPFRIVFYAVNLFLLQGCTLSGYKIVDMQSMPAFRVLVVVFFVWTGIVIMYTLARIGTTLYHKRQNPDSMIVMQFMDTLAEFIDAKDDYTRDHSIRVAEYAAEISRLMKMNRKKVSQMYYTALMHDCGKISIPDEVLKKKEKLTVNLIRISFLT
jgi:HD-GYP domain-containing protein (c-di-GMP phosphodiesterase class II)